VARRGIAPQRITRSLPAMAARTAVPGAAVASSNRCASDVLRRNSLSRHTFQRQEAQHRDEVRAKEIVMFAMVIRWNE
jgi:hypothetical protein